MSSSQEDCRVIRGNIYSLQVGEENANMEALAKEFLGTH